MARSSCCPWNLSASTCRVSESSQSRERSKKEESFDNYRGSYCLRNTLVSTRIICLEINRLVPLRPNEGPQRVAVFLPRGPACFQIPSVISRSHVVDELSYERLRPIRRSLHSQIKIPGSALGVIQTARPVICRHQLATG